YNPYLNDGDVVRVGAYDPAQHAVFVGGAVPNPGAFPHRLGDTAADLLALAGANTTSGTDSVRVTSSRTGQAKHYALTDALADVTVQPLDRIHVYAAVELRGTVQVEGRVRYPGTYPIVEGETSLQDVVAQAGGLRPDALVRGVYLQRQPRASATAPPSEGQDAADVRASMQARLQADTLNSALNLRLANLDFLSRMYLADELRLSGRVALDLSEAMQPGAAPVLVRDGDRLVVPEDDGTVLVVGQVNRPGRIAAQPDASMAAYLTAAGLTTPQAGTVYLIEAGTGQFLTVEEATPQTGDIIFVDRLEDAPNQIALERLALERERARYDQRIRRSQIWVQVGSVVAALASAYSTYLLTRR
ncbi:MAG: SLBB domain-containing protein, partial [Bacteroidota bacterium]